VLTLNIPKREEAKPKQIKVNVGGQTAAAAAGAKIPPRRRFFCSLEWGSMGLAPCQPLFEPMFKKWGSIHHGTIRKLTVKAQEALEDAQEVAARHEIRRLRRCTCLQHWLTRPME